MYQIKCDGHTLHDSRSNNVRVLEAKCDMELNKTGTLSFTIPPTHPFFDQIKKHKSELSLYQDGEWVFTGRVLNDEIDIYGYKKIEVEGMLGYLLDSIQRAKEYHITGANKIQQYLTDVLSIHNSQVDVSKQILVGEVSLDDASDQLYKISSYKDTLTTINEDLIKTFGGYFFAKVRDGVKRLDYLKIDDFPINNQIIQFGKNILSLKKTVKGEDIATVILPLGEKKSSTTGDSAESELKEHINLSTLGYSKDGTIVHEAGSECIYDEEAVREYGRITKVIEWGDVTEPANLLAKAKEQLNFYKADSLSLELSVFDLHLLNLNIQSLRVGQKIRVVSIRHNLDQYMIVQKIVLDIDQVDKSTVTLVTEERSAVDVNSGNSGGISNKITDTSKNVISIQQDLSDSTGGGVGDNIDLSGYATVIEVNSAFDELAVLIGGM